MNSSEIARIANVSRSTVSRVLNNYDNVPEATRLKVQAVIEQYGYTPNHSARMLAGKTNNILGIYIADIYEDDKNYQWVGVRSPYHIDILANFIDEAKKHGYLTLVDTITDLNNCADIESNFSNRMLHGGLFIGFPYRTKMLEQLGQKNYNIVIADQLAENETDENHVKLLNSDNLLGGYTATNYLIQHGHTKILHVGGDNRLSAVERLKGYLNAMKDAGISKRTVISGMYHEDISYQETKKYLTNLAKEQYPTAVFAANDIVALGVIRAIQELGLSVPHDISVIGYDNLQQAEWRELHLTTVDPQKKQFAIAAVHMLLDKPNITAPPHIIIERNTVRKI